MDLTKMSRQEVHDLMIESDRKRARIAYAGLGDLEDKLERQGIKPWHKRHEDRVKAHEDKNRRQPEYVEANALFNACSDRLREIDGDSIARDRNGKKIRLFF